MIRSEEPQTALHPAPHPAEDRSAIDRAVQPARVALRTLGVVLLAVMIALPVLQVGLRELTRLTFIGAGELTRFMLICVVFVCLPYVVSSGASIRMEELTAGLRGGLARALRMAVAGSGAVAFAVASWSVAAATLRNLGNATPTLGIPYWIFFSAAFAGLLLAALECAIQFVKAWRGRDLYVSFAGELPPDDLPEL